jgi:hypothetical protein
MYLASLFANDIFGFQLSPYFLRSPSYIRLKTAELMAIWDYEGKLESRGWSQEQCL